MSSSRHHHHKKGRDSHTSNYPTAWSQWEWDAAGGAWRRWRYDGRGQVEWENDLENTTTAAATSEPRTQPTMPVITEPTGSYPSNRNYTTTSASSMDAMTQQFGQSTLDPQANYQSMQQPVSQMQGRPQLSYSQYHQPQNTSQPEPAGSSQLASKSGSGKRHVTTIDPTTSAEPFDPHYKVHPSGEFSVGRIFKVLWSEPSGANTKGNDSDGYQSTREGQYGEKLFQKVRRFLIVSARDGHCMCLPIMTYTGQGVNKKGVKAKYHAVIYTGKKPVVFDGEKSKGLKMSPIKMVPSSSRHKLDNASRLNYAKQYTVEHNVKVWFIGEVSPDSEDQLVEDYNKTNPPMEKGKGRSKGKIVEEEDEYYDDQTQNQAHPAYSNAASASYSTYPTASPYTPQVTGYSYASSTTGSSATPQYRTPGHTGYDQPESTGSYFENQPYQQPDAGSYSAYQGGSQSTSAAPESGISRSEASHSEAPQHTLPRHEAEEAERHVAADTAKDDEDPGDTHSSE